jgi:hypothetical protein
MIMRLWSRWRRTNDFIGRICTFEYVAGFGGRIVQAILSRIRLGFLKLNKQNLYYLGEVLNFLSGILKFRALKMRWDAASIAAIS